MRYDELPAALLALVCFVALAPALTYWTSAFAPPRPADMFLALIVAPSLLALFIVGWVKPEAAGLVTGVIVLAGVMLLAPYWWRFVEMGTGQLTSNPAAQALLQLALPVVILLAVGSLGFRRLQQ